MKRMSIAERTLQAQIVRIERDIAELERGIETKIAVSNELRSQVSVLKLEAEMLAKARTKP